jgi:hypothetical protein
MKLELLIVVILSSVLLMGIESTLGENEKWHIAGIVLDQYGSPVQGALIQNFLCDPDRTTNCYRMSNKYTDKNGKFEFTLDPKGVRNPANFPGIGLQATIFLDSRFVYRDRGWYFGFTPGVDVDNIEIRLGYRYTPEEGYVEHPEYLNTTE